VFQSSSSSSGSGGSSSSASSSETVFNLTGFRTGVKPERILRIEKTESGRLVFLIKWKNMNEADLIPASVANLKWPQLVIGFYEERMEWQNVYKTDEDEAQNQDEVSMED